ncbi:MAG: TetR/AcrR family transcriptional regulator [Pseudomonadota bacterium]
MAPDERREQLLASAVRAFGEHGVARAKHADVAAAAGVSEATVFVYFPTRQALREAVFAHFEQWALTLAETTLGSALPGDLAIEAHLKGAADLFARKPEEVRIWIGWSMAIEDELWPRYRQLQQAVLGQIERALRRGQGEGVFDPAIDAEEAAIGILGAAYMIGQTQFEGKPKREIDRYIETLVDRFRARVPARQAAVGSV